MMKKFVLWVMIVTAVGVPSVAVAASTPYQDYDATFDYSLCGADQEPSYASVHSWVEQDNTNDSFFYFYQVKNVSPDYLINYFQFSIPQTPLAGFNYGATNNYNGITGDIGADWGPLDLNGTVYGLGGRFSTAVSTGKTSFILWFESELSPVQSAGSMSGFSPTGYVTLCGDVFAPVPEPSTMFMLLSGAAFMIRRKRN